MIAVRWNLEPLPWAIRKQPIRPPSAAVVWSPRDVIRRIFLKPNPVSATLPSGAPVVQGKTVNQGVKKSVKIGQI